MCEGKYNFKVEDNSNRKFLLCVKVMWFLIPSILILFSAVTVIIYFFAFIFKTTLMSLEIRKGQLIINNAQSVNIHIDLTL